MVCPVKKKSDQPEDDPWKGRNMSLRETMLEHQLCLTIFYLYNLWFYTTHRGCHTWKLLKCCLRYGYSTTPHSRAVFYPTQILQPVKLTTLAGRRTVICTFVVNQTQ